MKINYCWTDSTSYCSDDEFVTCERLSDPRTHYRDWQSINKLRVIYVNRSISESLPFCSIPQKGHME